MTAVTGHGWLLSLHVLAAFTIGAPLVVLLVVAAVARRPGAGDRLSALSRATGVAAGLFRGGLVAALVLGTWLVFSTGGYSITDGWVIAAVALWLAIGGLGDRGISRLRQASARTPADVSGAAAGAEPDGARAGRSALWFGLGAAVAVVVEIAVMVWRPGA